MSPVHQDQLRRISVRWAQAHQRRDLLDWHSFTGMLMNMACNAMRIADNAEDSEFASDLYTLSGLSYYRSTEYLPPDLSRLPHLVCEAA